MAKITDLTATGWPTWLALFEALVPEKLHEHAEIDLIHEDEKNRRDHITTQQIRAGAFDEIFPNLPTKEAMEIIKEMVNDTAGKQREIFLQFLDKIPTRQ